MGILEESSNLPLIFKSLLIFPLNPNQSYLKSNSGNVTDGVTLTTETGNQDLVVLLNVI